MLNVAEHVASALELYRVQARTPCGCVLIVLAVDEQAGFAARESNVAVLHSYHRVEPWWFHRLQSFPSSG
jgi:hypothetical protein